MTCYDKNYTLCNRYLVVDCIISGNHSMMAETSPGGGGDYDSQAAVSDSSSNSQPSSLYTKKNFFGRNVTSHPLVDMFECVDG